MMVTRRELLAAAAASATLGLALAATAQEQDAAVARIRAFYDSLNAAMGGAADPKQRLATVSDAIMQTFDIGAMVKLAVGPQWAKIPVPKQAALQDAFGRYFVATYGTQLGKASGSRFEVMPKAEPKTGGQLVRTRVTDPEGKITPVDYLVNADGKVVDIYLGGTVSMIATRRSEFGEPLKAGGPDALEAYLRKRADELTSK
jgi:phospholipid transport system substrate-binding protein